MSAIFIIAFEFHSLHYWYLAVCLYLGDLVFFYEPPNWGNL